MPDNFRALIGIAYDLKQAQSELDRQIKSLQKNTKLALNIELTDKEAKKVIQDSTKMWSNYRKEAVQSVTAPNAELIKMKQYYKDIEKQSDSFNRKNLNAIDYEIKQREDSSKVFSNQIKLQMQERLDAENKVQTELKNTAKEQKDAFNLKFDKNILDNNISSFLQKNSKLSDELKNRLIEIQKQVQIADKTKLGQLKKSFQEVSSEATRLNQTGGNIFQSLLKHAGELVGFLGATTLVIGGYRQIQNMIGAVKNLDDQLLELSKVTDLSANGLSKIVDQAYALGDAVGKTGTSALSTITEFVRAGYTLQESMGLAQEALKTINISENIKDASVAAEDLIHILNGLGESADYAKTINDSINQVSNTQAVDFDNLVDGSTRLSAVAKQAGVSFQQMLGILTAGYSTLGDMEKVASGAITIFSRLQSVQLEGEDKVETVAKLQKDFSSATNGVVNIVDKTTGQLRNAYDILNDLDSVWGSLDKNTREALAFEAAGTRQKSVLLSILDNWDMVKESVQSASESMGSSDKENEKYLLSLSGRVEAFKSKYEELSQEVISSDFLKIMVSSGANALDVLTQIIDKLGLFPTLLSAISGGLSIKNSSFIQTTDTGLTTVFNKMYTQSKLAKTAIEDVSATLLNYNTNIKTSAIELDKFNKTQSTDTITTYLQSLNGAEASLNGYNTSLKTTTVSSVGLKVASFALNSALTLGAGILIQFGVTALYKYLNAQQEAINKANELTSAYQESSNSIKSNIDTLDSLRNEFSELSKGVDNNGNNVGLSTEQYSRYKAIVQQVIDISPSLVKGYNNEGEAIVNNNSLLQDAINLQKVLNEQDLQEYLSKGDDIVKGARNEISKIKGEIYKLSTTNWSGDGLYSAIWGNGDDSKNFDEFQSKLKNIGVDLNGIFGGQVDTLKNVVTNKEKVIALAVEENDLSEEQKQKLSNQIDLIDIQLGKIDTANGKVKSLLSLWSTSTENQDWYNNIDTGFLDEFQSTLGQISSDSTMSIDEMEVATRNLGTAFLDIQDQIPTSNIEELNNEFKNGDITSEQYNKDLKTQIGSIESLADTYSISNPILAAFLNLIAQSYTDFSNSSNAIDNTTNSIKSLSDVITSIDNVSKSMNSLDSAYAKLKSKEKLDISDITALQESFGNTNGFEKFIMTATSAKSVTSDVQNAFDNLVTTYVNTSGVLDGLNDSNKDMITSQLELMGITNAEAIVTKRLAEQKLILADTGVDVSNATADEIISLLNETDVADGTRLALVDLATQKLGVNDVALSTSGDIQNLLSLMAASNATSESLKILAAYKDPTQFHGFNPGHMDMGKLIADAQEEVDAFYKGLGGSSNNVQYSGGSKTSSDKTKSDKSSSSSSSDDKYLDAYNAEKATLDHKLAMDEITEKQYYDKLEKLNNKYFKKHQKKYLEQYRQNQEEIHKGRKQLDEDAIKSQFDTLDYQHEIGFKVDKNGNKTKKVYSDEDYYNDKLAYAKQYYTKNGKVIAEYLDTYRAIYTDYYNWQQDEAEKKAQEQLDKQQKLIDGVISKFDKSLSNINDTASDSENGSPEQISAYTKGLKTAGDEVSYLESQLAKLKKQYKDGKISQENYVDQLANLTDKLNEAKDSVKSYQKSIIESIKAQQEAQTDLVTDAYDKEKEAIEDRYDTELDSLNKIINAKKKSLQADKDAQDYQKNLAEKTDTVSDIDKRIIDLSKAANSDDREAQAELKQLQEDRLKAQQELDDLQADHKLSVEEDALDKLADDYQTQADKNKTIDLNNAKSVHDDKLAKINSLYQREEELIAHASEYTKKQFSESLKEINTQLSNLGINTPKSTTDGLVNSYNDLAGIDVNGSNDAKILSIITNGKGKGIGTSKLNRYIAENYNGKPLTYTQMAELADLLGMSGVTAKNIVGDTKTKDEIYNKLKKARFKTGGYVDASMIRASGEDGLALVRHGEPILTVEQGKQFSELIKNIQPLNNLVKLATPNISNITTNNTNSSPIINVTIPISGNADLNTVKQLNSSANNMAQQVAKAIIDVKRTR